MTYTRKYSNISSALRALKSISNKYGLYIKVSPYFYYNNRSKWAKIEKVLDGNDMYPYEKVIIKANFEF